MSAHCSKHSLFGESQFIHLFCESEASALHNFDNSSVATFQSTIRFKVRNSSTSNEEGARNQIQHVLDPHLAPFDAGTIRGLLDGIEQRYHLDRDDASRLMIEHFARVLRVPAEFPLFFLPRYIPL